jgi:hypothetical protein
MDVVTSVKTEQALTVLYPVVDDCLFRIDISFSEYRLHSNDIDNLIVFFHVTCTEPSSCSTEIFYLFWI